MDKKIQIGIIGVLVLIITVLFVVFTYAPSTEESAKPGQEVEIQGNQHIKKGEDHPKYNSLPPTSGWHYDKAPDWGIYDNPLEDESQIHALEHGGIMVQYRQDIDAATIENLKSLASKYKSKVILAPYTNLDQKIALTAWGRIDKFDEFDEKRIEDFINAFKNKGPEYIPE